MRLEYFQMIDRIVALNVGERTVRSLCMVPKQSTIFEGHFPNYPLMPGVLLIECMAQTTGWLVIALGGFTNMPFLAAVKDGKFRTAVSPGDTLEIEGKVIHEGSGYAMAECQGKRGNTAICDAKLTFRIMPYPSPQFRQSMLEWAQRIDVPIKEFVK
jgi:3-hydroxyacyl-[acyl-carrier-protein] dehydratase